MDLPKARYAHLATHGEFKEALLAEERKRVEEQLKNWQGPSPTGTERIGLGRHGGLTTAQALPRLIAPVFFVISSSLAKTCNI